MSTPLEDVEKARAFFTKYGIRFQSSKVMHAAVAALATEFFIERSNGRVEQSLEKRVGKKKEGNMGRYIQCSSMYPTREGAVFCTNPAGAGHTDDHVGYRKKWRMCTKCKGTGRFMLDGLKRGCAECKGIGNVLVKKEKPAAKGAEG